MDVAHLLTDNQPPGHSRRAHPSIEDNHGSYQPWQNNGIDGVQRLEQRPLDLSPQRPGAIGAANSPYSSTLPPKSVAFEYILPEPLQQKARLPMRVNIYPHDATDSIITTVKNFYGLYDGNGVSFEDKEGNTLIARYENFQNRMTVYVRVVDDMGSASATPHVSLSPKRPYLGPPFEMNPPPQVGDHLHSRPSSRAAHHRSASPNNTRGRRSVSVNTNTKSRSRPNIKSRTGSAHGSFADPNGQFAQDMSDSDGGDASVTSSRRGKAEVVASAEISVENIVEGGRRKRARFDSSELPLFVPSQVPMPTSISSVSPQRRIGLPNAASPYQYSNQHTFAYTHPFPSPQSHGYSDMAHMSNGGGYPTPGSQAFGNRALRQRPSPYAPARHASGSGIMPTPDPTIGSVISDEDVALQLMRLGDASNFSSHGRTSTSTVDDALSGKAEASDYSGEDSDVDDPDLPRAGYNSDEYSAEDVSDRQDASFKGESDGIMPGHMHMHTHIKPKMTLDKRDPNIQRKSLKPSKPSSLQGLQRKQKPPMSPTSLPTQSRKTSNASLTLGPDEEDLSTKPRCQRCRKSKKGCDRQRPCGRCRDAGIGIEGCVSEDEYNGRKGRYGRHMGVSVALKEGGMGMVDVQPLAVVPIMHQHMPMGPPSLMGIGGGGKKRKR